MICGGYVDNDGSDWNYVSSPFMSAPQIFEFDENTLKMSRRGKLQKPDMFSSTSVMTLSVNDEFLK